MSEINLLGFGYAQSTNVTANKTVSLADSGIVQNVTAAGVTITLPSTAVAANFIVRVGAPDITVTVAPAAADKISGNGFTALANKALLFTNQPVGAYVEIQGDGSTGWIICTLHESATRQP